MSRSFGNIYTSKKCNCDISNWVKYKTKNSYRRPDANIVINVKLNGIAKQNMLKNYLMENKRSL